MLDFIKNISPVELIIIALILVVIFGGRAMISLAKTSGETVKEMKKIKKGFMEAIDDDDDKKPVKS